MSKGHKCPVCGAGLTMSAYPSFYICDNLKCKGGNVGSWGAEMLVQAAATRAREIAEATEPLRAEVERLRGVVKDFLEWSNCNGQRCAGNCLGCIWEDRYADCGERVDAILARAEAALDHIGDVNEMVGGSDETISKH